MFHMHAWLKMGGIRGHQERKGDASNLVVLVWLIPKDFVSFGKLVAVYLKAWCGVVSSIWHHFRPCAA